MLAGLLRGGLLLVRRLEHLRGHVLEGAGERAPGLLRDRRGPAEVRELQRPVERSIFNGVLYHDI